MINTLAKIGRWHDRNAVDLRKELFEIILSALIVAAVYQRWDVVDDIRGVLDSNDFPYHLPAVYDRDLYAHMGTLQLPKYRSSWYVGMIHHHSDRCCWTPNQFCPLQ